MTRSLVVQHKNNVWQGLTIRGVLLGGALLASLASAQQDAPKRGFQVGVTYQLQDIESIGLSTRQLSYNIPLASLPPGPGGQGFTLSLNYNSTLFDGQVQWTRDINDEPSRRGYAYHSLIGSNEGGWVYGLTYTVLVDTRAQSMIDEIGQVNIPCGYGEEADHPFRVAIRFPDGSRHNLAPAGGDLSGEGFYDLRADGVRFSCSGRTRGDAPATTQETVPVQYYSVDGSRLRLVPDTVNASHPTTWRLYFPDGAWVHEAADGQHRYDRNGNSITVTSAYEAGKKTSSIVSDSLGRMMKITYCDPVAAPPCAEAVFTCKPNIDPCNEEALDDPTKRVETLVWRKWFLAGDRPYYGTQRDGFDPNKDLRTASISASLVQRIMLPDATGAPDRTGPPGTCTPPDTCTPPVTASYYEFDYYANPADNCDWLQVKSLRMPSGATVDYVHSYPPLCNSGTDFERVFETRLLSKSLHHDNQTDQWTYPDDNGGNRIIAPDGGETKVGCGYGLRDFYRDAGIDTPGKRVERIWAGDQSLTQYNGLGGVNPYVKTEFTSITNEAGTAFTKTKKTDFVYDRNGNVLETWDYDWMDYGDVVRTTTNPQCPDFPTGAFGAGKTPTLLRKTVSTYQPSAGHAEYSDPNDANAYFNLIGTDADRQKPLNLVQSRRVYNNDDSTASYATYEYDAKGNLHVETNHASATQTIVRTYEHDALGNLTQTTDGRGTVTAVTYQKCNNLDAYPKTVKRGPSSDPAYQETEQVFNCATGLLMSSQVKEPAATDQQILTSYTYDTLGRLTEISAGNLAAHTQFEYGVGAGDDNRWIQTTSPAGVVTKEYFDHLWRPSKTHNLASDVQTKTKYKTVAGTVLTGANYTLVSNPHLSSGNPDGWILSKRDTANRVVREETFSGSAEPSPFGGNPASTGAVTTVYAANVNTVTDQAVKKRRNTMNGLDQLTEVVEDPDDRAYSTQYVYNAAGSLTNVLQGSRPRWFTYDWMGRLKSATNPESGLISYEYDGNGNLTQRTDALDRVTTMGYDLANRITSKTYSDSTLPVTYCYDGKVPSSSGTGCEAGTAAGAGDARRLTGVRSGLSTARYTFDSLGRTVSSLQTTDGVPFPFVYVWNAADQLTNMQYPSQKWVSYCYDNAFRPKAVGQGETVGCEDTGDNVYASQVEYKPHGAIAQMRLGNTFYEQSCYNSRLQTEGIRVGAALSSSYCSNFAPADGLLSLRLSYGPASSNNGNVTSQTIDIGTAQWTQTYDYDGLNRVKYLKENDVDRQIYVYDRYGNRAVKAGTQYFIPTPGLTPQVTTESEAEVETKFPDNRWTNPEVVQYDGDAPVVGNITRMGSQTLSYDAENRLISSVLNDVTTTYAYDGEGRRVRKQTGGATTVYVYDAQGQMAAEYATQVTEAPCPTPTCYLTVDHLGSTRLVTNDVGGLAKRYDYAPFGEEVPAGEGGRTADMKYSSPFSDTFSRKFTGKERDAETGLDYFGARYLSSAQGRWTSPDWSERPQPVPYADLSDPQTLNLYAFVSNNPLRARDFDGHAPLCMDKADNTSPQCHVDPAPTQPPAQAPAPPPPAQPQGEPAWSDPAAVLSAIRGAQGEVYNEARSVLPVLQDFPEFSPSNPIEKASMGVTSVAVMFVPIAGEGNAGVSVYMKARGGYVGISNNLARRAAQHGEPLVELVGGLTRQGARGVEQAMIEREGLPNLTNKINSIARSNPIYQEAVAFGRKLLSSLGF